MATKPTIDGDIAKALFASLGADAADVIEALADMNDATLSKHAEAYWRAATADGRNAAFIARILELLARGEYQEARQRLGIGNEKSAHADD